MKEFNTYYLELTNHSELKTKTDAKGLVINECKVKQFLVNRFLYHFIGKTWNWTDRNSWSDKQWVEYAENKNLLTFIAYSEGSPAGYFELQLQDNNEVEVVLFGLAPKFIGMGFGGYFLSKTLEYAWDIKETKRVWLHTCTHDHEHALQNYIARGMKLYKTSTEKLT
jgi:GNAT superfamily N-acetyltransferase